MDGESKIARVIIRWVYASAIKTKVKIINVRVSGEIRHPGIAISHNARIPYRAIKFADISAPHIGIVGERQC